MLPALVRLRRRGQGVDRRRTRTTAWRCCRRCAREWPFFRTLLSNMDMVLAKSDIGIASRYKDLVEDAQLREAIFARLRAEWESSSRRCCRSSISARCWSAIPRSARTIRDRFPYIDPLNHVQLELLETPSRRRYRRARGSGHPPHDQRDCRRLAQQRVDADEGTLHRSKLYRHHLP